MSAILRVRTVFNAAQAGMATDAEVSWAIDEAIREFGELQHAWGVFSKHTSEPPTSVQLAEATLGDILGGK